ncbi:MAG TPA: hypothetical protein VMY88_11200 [Acidimicrobiales bacterium]|nr:hypothetical protein [Acidimicrobiales bacterium]
MTDATTQEFGSEGGQPARGDLIEDRYRLEERLGGGVTATTWRAHDPVLGRDVAVKVWTDASDDAHRSQQDELSAARLLDPNLNELLDAGSHAGRPFLVREIALEHPADPTPPLSAAVAAPEAPNTPPAGMASAPPARRGDRVVMISVGAIVVAAVLVAAGLVVRPGASDAPDEAAATHDVAPTEITSFDPKGDGRENPDELGALLDDDSATTWRSDRYNSPNFGNLKPGLGLVLTFSPAQELDSVEVVSEAGGWSGQVHVATSAAPEFEDWGAPVDTVDGSRPSEELDLGGRTVGAVLIWFTDLGTESNRLTISGLRVRAAQ